MCFVRRCLTCNGCRPTANGCRDGRLARLAGAGSSRFNCGIGGIAPTTASSCAKSAMRGKKQILHEYCPKWSNARSLLSSPIFDRTFLQLLAGRERHVKQPQLDAELGHIHSLL